MDKEQKKKSEQSQKTKKGYTDQRHPVIIELDNYLKTDAITITECCRVLRDAYNIGTEYTPNVWYQRIIKLRSGEYKTATEKELQAIKRFIHVDINPHLYGSIIHSLGDINRKTSQIEKYLRTGYQNKTETAKRIKELKTLNTLSIDSISESQ